MKVYMAYVIRQLKQQDTSKPLLEWPKFKILATLNADKDVKQQELSFIASGNVK